MMLECKGRVLRLSRGESGDVFFKFSEIEAGKPVKVEVCEVVGGLDVRVKEVCAEKRHAVISVKVHENAQLQPLMLAKLKFTQGSLEEEAYIGVVPLGSRALRVTVKCALKDDKNYSVGAPGFVKKEGKYYLAYRWRNGSARGEYLEIAESSDGLSFTEVKKFSKVDYGYESFEKSVFARRGDEVVFLYCADVTETWNIFKVICSSPREAELPGEVFIENAKDPALMYDPELGEFIVVFSYLENPGHDLVVATSKDLKDFTVKANTLAYGQFREQGNKWARTHIHPGTIDKVGEYYVLFYDAIPKNPSCFGSGWLGVAISKDLKKWIDLTPDKPLWQGKGPDKTFRYVAVHAEPSQYILYAEEELETGRKDLIAYVEQ